MQNKTGIVIISATPEIDHNSSPDVPIAFVMSSSPRSAALTSWEGCKRDLGAFQQRLECASRKRLGEL